MRLIDADKLQPDRMTDKGLAISQSQIANAPTVCDIEQIRAEIQKEADNRATPYGMKIYYRCLNIIDKYTKGDKDAYDDNRACEQDDVAYELKVALDIIKEHTKGDN